MKKWVLMTSALWISAAVFAADGAKINQNVGLGTDCEIFLNPYIESELKDVSGQMVLNVGSGLAPHAIIAAKNGANVHAVETKKQMLEQAQALVQKAGFGSQICFYQGNLEELALTADTFDKALSVNASTSTPTTMQVISEGQYRETDFCAHFSEIARLMKEGGRLMVAAPASYGVVFTTENTSEEAARQHIVMVLAQIGNSQDPAVITEHLSELKEITRATFVVKDGRLQLVTNENDLRIGQQIWCKIPEGVVSSIYHSEEEYLVALKRAGLTCEEIKRPCFFGPVKYDMWRKTQSDKDKSLGVAYMNHHPFTIYYVVKKA